MRRKSTSLGFFVFRLDEKRIGAQATPQLLIKQREVSHLCANCMLKPLSKQIDYATSGLSELEKESVNVRETKKIA